LHKEAAHHTKFQYKNENGISIMNFHIAKLDQAGARRENNNQSTVLALNK